MLIISISTFLMGLYDTRAEDTRAGDARAVDARAVDARAGVSQKVETREAVPNHLLRELYAITKL